MQLRFHLCGGLTTAARASKFAIATPLGYMDQLLSFHSKEDILMLLETLHPPETSPLISRRRISKGLTVKKGRRSRPHGRNVRRTHPS